MSGPEDFVRRFVEYWAGPDPERLPELLTADVVLAQPLSPTTHGLQAAKLAFHRLFAQFPDLRGTVDRWRGDDQHVFIELRLHATLGGSAVEWPVVDRFTLRADGDRLLASERVSYFDPLPLVGKLLRHPIAAWRATRGGATLATGG